MFLVALAAIAGLALGMTLGAGHTARDVFGGLRDGGSRGHWFRRLFCAPPVTSYKTHTVYVFHPTADGGGGGEKCLWAVLKALIQATGVRKRPKDSAWRRWKRSFGFARFQTRSDEGHLLAGASEESNANGDRNPGGSIPSSPSRATGNSRPAEIPLRTRVILLVKKQCLPLQQMLSNTRQNFQIDLIQDLSVSPTDPDVAELTVTMNGTTYTLTLELRRMQTAWMLMYPYQRATRLLQMLSGVPVAFEAVLMRLFKDTALARNFAGPTSMEIWDTVGCIQAASVFSFLTSVYHVKVRTYTHWPFIDRGVVNRNPMGSQHRWWYDATVLTLYHLAGTWGCWRPVVVNSTYTSKRLSDTWNMTGEQYIGDEAVKDCTVVFPPVMLDPVTPPDSGDRENVVISLSQFRAEKNHRLQIDIIRRLILEHDIPEATHFLICGQSRPGMPGDSEYLMSLVRYAIQTLPVDSCILKSDPERLLIESQEDLFLRRSDEVEASSKKHVVEFKVNRPMTELAHLMRTAKVALHTMFDEHFGIVVVDFLTHGLWVVAHDSAGPRDDILRAPSAEECRNLAANDMDGQTTGTRNSEAAEGQENNEQSSTVSHSSVAAPSTAKGAIGRVGYLAKTEQEFCDGVVMGLRGSKEVVSKIRLGQQLARLRFRDTEGFGKQLLDTWAIPDRAA